MDSIRGPEGGSEPAVDSLAATIVGQVQAMQNALKEDQELVVICNNADASLRVLEIFAPSPKLLVLTGQDLDRNLARLIVPAENVNLLCRPTNVAVGTKPTRLRLVVAKPKA